VESTKTGVASGPTAGGGRELARRLTTELHKRIVGQDEMIERVLIGLLTGGHVLLEGVPGLAKTLTVSSLAECISATFHRVQFTPDLLPADVVGTMIYDQRTGEFSVKKGPIFANLVLADEINRAPPKVQSALLEAMQERQVTIGGDTLMLPEPFLVLATQNPIEQEGTYPLPEAQVDRFMLKLRVTYPSKDTEKEIMRRMAGREPEPLVPEPRQVREPRAAQAPGWRRVREPAEVRGPEWERAQPGQQRRRRRWRAPTRRGPSRRRRRGSPGRCRTPATESRCRPCPWRPRRVPRRCRRGRPPASASVRPCPPTRSPREREA